MHATTNRPPDVTIPADLQSAKAKLVYLYLAVRESATADDICAAIDARKGTVLQIARGLCERGYVRRVGSRYELV